MKSTYISKQAQSVRLTPLAAEMRRAFAAGSLGAALISLPLCALAGPAGGQVVAGQAGITQGGATTTVNQQSQRAVVNWNSFNVGTKETVNFNQPNANAAILNRVTGADPSSILGRINANGQVYLVNPNGIMFGKGSQINVGSLVASTANIGNADFMAGRMQFKEPGKPGATVVNEGTITVADGGFVGLVAPGVRNSGVITAKLGKVALAAGEAFVLDLHGDGLISLVVDPAAMETMTDASGTPFAAFVDQSGNITAEGGQIAISASTAKGLVDSIINVGGVLRATAFESKPGVISLKGDSGTKVAVAGTLDTSGAQGGRVEITGRDVSLASTASINASGSSSTGGSVSVGGDWQGKGPLMNAQKVEVARGARIDATGATGGGTVAVWSDGSTKFNGEIENRGGNVEVSGKQNLAFDGDVRAANLLLDPTNLTVVAQGSEYSTSPPAAGDSTIAVDSINKQLLQGTAVSLQATDNLTVASQIDGRGEGGKSGGSVSLKANDIALNANVLLNNGNFTAEAGRIVKQADNAVIYTGSGNNVTVKISGASGVELNQIVTSGSVNLESASGKVSVSKPVHGLSGDALSASASLNITAGSDVTLNGAKLGSGGLEIISTSGNVDMGSGGIQSLGAVSLSAGKILTIREGGIKVDAAQQIALTGKTGVSAAGPIATDGGNIVIQSDRDITLNQMATRLSSGVSSTSVPNGDVTITSTGGDVVLNKELGSANTGYDSFDKRYQANLRPDLGRLAIRAAGSVETNGLNLDGNPVPTAESDGLRIEAGKRLIVNGQIAVNKGAIWLESKGNGETDGVYLGNNVYSRGYDPLSNSINSSNPYQNPDKLNYKINIKAARNINLFDNSNEQVDFYLAYQGDAYVEPTKPGSSFPLLEAEDPRLTTPRPAPAYSSSIAKIIVSNHTANYKDGANANVLVDGRKPASIITIEGNLTGTAIAAGTRLRANSNVSSTSLQLTPNSTTNPDAETKVEKAGQGISLKVLAPFSTADESTRATFEPCTDLCNYNIDGLSYQFKNTAIIAAPGVTSAINLSGLNIEDSPVATKIAVDKSAMTPDFYLPISDSAPYAISGRYVEAVNEANGNANGSRILLYGGDIKKTARVPSFDRPTSSKDVNPDTGINNSSTALQGYATIGGFGSFDSPNTAFLSRPVIPPVNPPGETAVATQVAQPPVDVGSAAKPCIETDAANDGDGNAASSSSTGCAGGTSTGSSAAGTSVGVASPMVPATGRRVTVIGARPIADADLGRGSSLGGSLRNVFATRYRIADATDASLQAPSDIEPGSSAP